MKKIITTLSIAMVSVLVLTSCRQPIHISSNTFADSQSIPYGFACNSSFYVIQEHKEHPLFAKEVAFKIRQLLSQRGYELGCRDTADYVITFNFGMRSSTTTINVPKYIPGETNIKVGHVYDHGWHVAHYQECSESPGTTVFVPEDYTVFTKTLEINVYDAELYQKDPDDALVWQGYAQNTDEHNDLRETIDYLMISAFKNFGKNSRKTVHERVRSHPNYLNNNLRSGSSR